MEVASTSGAARMVSVRPDSSFGALLRHYRQAAGFTLEELATLAGLSAKGISALERGERQIPRKDTVARLASALELPDEHRAVLIAAARRRAHPSRTDAMPQQDSRLRVQEAATGLGQSEVSPALQDSTATPERDLLKPLSLNHPQPPSPGGIAHHRLDERQSEIKEERRLVTLLFASIDQSTPLGESLDPEDVGELMGLYFSHARRVLEAHGGTMEKVIGDTVMAVFGVPRARSSDAERALAAALALRAAVANDPVLSERFALRIGANTGEVVATPDVSGGSFLVTSDLVTVTARIQAHATNGEILVGSRTQLATEAAFAFGAARSVAVRSKRQTMRVFPLLRSHSARRINRPQLVGRRQDLAQLTLLHERALEEHHPQLVSIVAPAGTGKTRLLEEFLAQFPPDAGFNIATARCVPYGQTLTYWPLRGLLEELMGGAVTATVVASAFAVGGHSQDDAERLAGLVLATLGVEPEGAAGGGTQRESIFSAWRLLVEAIAKRGPAIVVFEDLHWASESLLDLVEYLMQPRTQAALLVVVTARPELLDRRPRWGGGQHRFSALALEPLNEGQTRELVSSLAKQLPLATREQIVERSGGNPFFVIELTRTLAARDLAGETSESTSEALPVTVQEALQERLDLLSTRERIVLQAAAVIGRAFKPATLRAMLAAPGEPEPNDVDSALDSLVARDLILPIEDGAFTFRHGLIRDVAYGRLARAQRIRLHLAAAAWFEHFAGGRLDEFVELIACHERDAAQLARQSTVLPSVPVDTTRAVRLLERAGELAGRAGAFSEARAYLQNAIELADAVDHSRLYEALGDWLAPGDMALAAYHRALDAWRADENRPPLIGARLLRKLVLILLRWHVSERPSRGEIIALVSEAERLAEEAEDADELWRVRTAERWWTFWGNELTPESAPAQMAQCLEAASYFEARGDTEAFSMALDVYAMHANYIGDYAASTNAAKRRLLAPALSPVERCDALAMLVEDQTESGDYLGALQSVREALSQRRPGEPATLLGYAAAIASLAAYLAGRWSDVADLAVVVEEAWEEWQGDPGFHVLTAGYVALLCVALAQEDDATPVRADAALRLVVSRRQPVWRALLEAHLHDDATIVQTAAQSITTPSDGYPGFWLLILITMFLSERGLLLPPTQLELLATHPLARYHDAFCQCTAIALALAGGDETQIAKAIAEAEIHGLISHAARMRLVLAQRTGDASHLERARPVLERLGDRQFLQRLVEVAAMLR
jgi:class 3 adenylate cyclase